jgi:hypothetical protein
MVEMAEDDEEDIFWAFLCNGGFPGKIALHCPQRKDIPSIEIE